MNLQAVTDLPCLTSRLDGLQADFFWQTTLCGLLACVLVPHALPETISECFCKRPVSTKINTDRIRKARCKSDHTCKTATAVKSPERQIGAENLGAQTNFGNSHSIIVQRKEQHDDGDRDDYHDDDDDDDGDDHDDDYDDDDDDDYDNDFNDLK